jgi:hypothetical protein
LSTAKPGSPFCAPQAITISIGQNSFQLMIFLVYQFLALARRMRPDPIPVQDDHASELQILSILLRESKSFHSSAKMFELSSAKHLSPNVRANVIGYLNRMVREGIAHFEGPTSSKIRLSALLRQSCCCTNCQITTHREAKRRASLLPAHARRDDLSAT